MLSITEKYLAPAILAGRGIQPPVWLGRGVDVRALPLCLTGNGSVLTAFDESATSSSENPAPPRNAPLTAAGWCVTP